VTGEPAAPIDGVTLPIIGSFAASTKNGSELVAEPVGVVTLIAPLVAPEGTVATSFVVVADVTEATVPLNLSVFSLAVVLNPVPKTEMLVPTAAPFGENSRIETVEELCREIERMFPTASYSYLAVSLPGSITATRRSSSSYT